MMNKIIEIWEEKMSYKLKVMTSSLQRMREGYAFNPVKAISTVLFIVAFVYCSNISYAQLEARYWYFGSKYGLRFDTNGPVTLSNNGMKAGVGASTISDKSGNLLFYGGTYSVLATLFNMQHDTLKNGFGLFSSACDQSPMIIPLPGNPDIYYVFTVRPPVGVSDTINSGFWYSIVDMSKDNGKGEVILKNQLIGRSVNNKLAATLHTDKKSVWILTKDFYSNKLKAYLLKNTGLDSTPVISSIGTYSITGWGDGRGQLKFSASGNKLANAIHYDCKVDIFDYNNKTGKASNCITIDSIPSIDKGDYTYGIEFSNNERFLYFSVYGYPGQLYQLDLNSGNENEIKNSLYPVYINTGPVGSRSDCYTCLQIGLDKKIYIN